MKRIVVILGVIISIVLTSCDKTLEQLEGTTWVVDSIICIRNESVYKETGEELLYEKTTYLENNRYVRSIEEDTTANGFWNIKDGKLYVTIGASTNILILKKFTSEKLILKTDPITGFNTTYYYTRLE
jgi:hypothetical protein